MDKWQYGFLTRVNLSQSKADRSITNFAFVQQTSGYAVHEFEFERFVEILDQLGAEGWILDNGTASELPNWCLKELQARNHDYDYNRSSVFRYTMRRRLD
jgi:hypothetical protein